VGEGVGDELAKFRVSNSSRYVVFPEVLKATESRMMAWPGKNSLVRQERAGNKKENAWVNGRGGGPV